MSKKIILACMAIAAFAAFVMPAAASAASPRLCETTENKECHNLAAGATLTAHNVGNTVMKIEGTTSTITCTTADLHGTLTRNEALGEAIEGNVTSATFTGAGTGEDCLGSGILGSFKVTTNVGEGTPWCMKALPGAAMELQVRGGLCSEGARKITFVLDSTSLGLECKYERTTATGPDKGTYNTDESSQDAIGTITAGANSTFVRESTSSSLCPEKGELEMAFTLTTTDGTTLYIK